MGTGLRATFVISWSQTEVDGLRTKSPHVLAVGAAWRWTGASVRIDAPGDVLLLEGAEGGADIRRRAARMVERLIGVATGATAPPAGAMVIDDVPDQSFVVTDGSRTHIVTLLPVRDRGGWLLMCLGEMPPSGRDLWVVRTDIDRSGDDPDGRSRGGVICFARGTRMLTPRGLRLIEELREGDLIQTRDNGAQEIVWAGSRRMTGARLYAMPHLRPIRFRAGAFGIDQPDADLLVSPQHRMLVRGAAARTLFNAEEVLVAAEDLVNDGGIQVDRSLRKVTYHHLLLDRHDIVIANGMETESFHPSAAALDTIEAHDRARLLATLPGVEVDPMRYGAFARRGLTASEAAILRYERAAGHAA